MVEIDVQLTRGVDESGGPSMCQMGKVQIISPVRQCRKWEISGLLETGDCFGDRRNPTLCFGRVAKWLVFFIACPHPT